MSDKTVMIVEDDFLHMKLFNDILKNQGYRTLRANNGEDALEMAREQHPDLILLDIRLPVKSGFEVVRELKGEMVLKDIPVIAVTASADYQDRDEYLSEGFDGFLSKPIAIPNMLKAIADFMRIEPYLVH
ncbi:MAG: response regulator [Alphaproteobacteria bacterium]|nr:response regulator [Alphaproteobacteria bacterium]